MLCSRAHLDLCVAARTGLGVDAFHRREKRRKLNAKVEAETRVKEDFSSRMNLKFQEHKLDKQIRQAFNSCVHMDEAKGIDSVYIKEEQARLAKEREEQLLREEQRQLGILVPPERPEVEEEMSFEEKAERLVTMLTYLRTTHCYCLYCGLPAYTSAEQLAAQCPGFTEEEHE